MLTALIVDDEPPARAELRYHLEQHADVEVVGEAGSGREAERLLAALTYDVVFLDIQMPGLSGLELARRLKRDGGRPAVVFVSAHDQYALEAFEVVATDYLVKPVDPRRLAAALDRVRAAPRPGAALPVGSGPRFLAGLDGDRTIPLPLDQVAVLVAEGDTVMAETTDGRRLPVRGTLQGLESSLPAAQFFRCHRSYIVNLDQVAEMLPFFNGTWLIRRRGGGAEVPVSRARSRRLKQLFGLS